MPRKEDTVCSWNACVWKSALLAGVPVVPQSACEVGRDYRLCYGQENWLSPWSRAPLAASWMTPPGLSSWPLTRGWQCPPPGVVVGIMWDNSCRSPAHAWQGEQVLAGLRKLLLRASRSALCFSEITKDAASRNLWTTQSKTHKH